MQIILDGNYTCERSVVALGMFDGVHLGHRVLLQRGAALARQAGVPLVVSTFQEHPLQVIAPEKCPPQLTTFEERAQLMEELGVDVLYAMPFDAEIMNMPPEDYVGHLVRRFHPTDVVCGYNHTFGRKGEGKPALLQFIGEALGFATSIVPNITLEGREVSSTAIRGHLAAGMVHEARKLLKRPYKLEAVQQGNVWHFTQPTKQIPMAGDYRVFAEVNEKQVPALLRICADGSVRCKLPFRVEHTVFSFLNAKPLAF